MGATFVNFDPDIQHYPHGIAGTAIPLDVVFDDAVGARRPMVGCKFTIRRLDKAAATVAGADANEINTGEYTYTFRPTVAGQYVGEWHAVAADGLPARQQFAIRIYEKIGELLSFQGSDPFVPPFVTASPLPGVFAVAEDSVVGSMVAVTAALTATTYATRAAAGPVAPSAFVYQKITPTTAHLAEYATLSGLSGLTPGAWLYLGVDGTFTHTQASPGADGELDQRVGFALSATSAALWTTDRGETVSSRVEVAYAATLSLDADTDYDMSNVLGGNLAVTVADAAEDMSGSLGLKQGAGGHTFSLACTGATVIHRGTDIASGAGKSSLVVWEIRRIAGVLQCWWDAVPEP